MKRILIVAAAGLLAGAASAQPWFTTGESRMKFEDIVAAYEKSRNRAEDRPKDLGPHGTVKGGKDKHFRRWEWYWEQQLDKDGYMVPPSTLITEWNKYLRNTSASGIKAKITNQANWTFQGPTSSPGGYNGIGRINVVAFHPTDTNTFIIGSAGGGAWRTEDGGLHWTSLYDHLPVLGVSDIDYNPKNPNTIYLCTGDRNASDTYSVGLLKSTDGGLTWNTTGLQYNITDFTLLNGLVINPLDTNSITVATTYGIRKSYDGGATWSSTTIGHFKEIVYSPADTNILFAASYSTGSANIFRSEDGGLNWQQVTTITGARRIALAVTPAAPGVVKAIVAANGDYNLQGIYSSSDTGKTFTHIYGDVNDCNTNILSGNTNLGNNSCSGQGWYDLCIAISPLNPDQVLIGGVNTYQSLDGGYSWDLVTRWTGNSPGVKVVHADKHYMAFHPLKPTTFFECNDGGLYKTSDPASLLWTDLSNGLGITQFYRNAVSNTANFVLGGSQDNGSKKITFAGTFHELTGGDGMDCQIDPSNPNTFYTSVQYGSIRRTTNNGANFTTVSNNIPGDPEGDWITPFVLHPMDPNTIIAGYEDVYLSTDQGDSWTDISNFSTSGQKIRRVAMTPANPDRIYILYSNAVIRWSDNLGATWNIITGAPAGRISDIQAHPKIPNKLLVTYSGYTTARVAEYTVGTGWKQMNDSLPNIPVNCIAIDSSDGTLYIGTDAAVFYKDSTMGHWALYNTNLPVVKVTDLGINYITNEIWASTYGRGMWKSEKHVPPAVANSIRNIPYAADVISVAPNPNAGSFAIVTENDALKDKQVLVRLTSYSGVSAMEVSKRFESNMLKIGNANLARGAYVVEVVKDGQVFARTKMIVQ